MHFMNAFNQAMDYIEQTLPDNIDETRIAQISGYSYPMFSRIFSILAGMPLSEYIRQRRLSEAAKRLRETDEKIIRIALDCGYDSPDAFSHAFKLLHGHSPSDVRNGKPFTLFPKLRLSLSIEGGNHMQIQIQKKPAFCIAGLERKNIESKDCPLVWDALFEKADKETLQKMGSGQSFGMCRDVKDENCINYMAGYDMKDAALAKKLHLQIVDIEAAEYAVVPLKGSIPDCIHAGWKYLMQSFFPEHGYRHSGKPDFEVYGAGDMYSSDYEMALWVPVEKAEE